MSNKECEQPTSTKEIMQKLDMILHTTDETLNLLKSFEKESEVKHGRYESIIGRNGKATAAD